MSRASGNPFPLLCHPLRVVADLLAIVIGFALFHRRLGQLDLLGLFAIALGLPFVLVTQDGCDLLRASGIGLCRY
ncbi:hypothetical protein [Bradyrhizobium sp.]|uniref:hypothetical protein n=1 Tax=Bradyrhizobium sp. TaxID=376 RepID=UPI0025C32BC6|nr:hypothetical protein [Bradyrhizobium sp.]